MRARELQSISKTLCAVVNITNVVTKWHLLDTRSASSTLILKLFTILQTFQIIRFYFFCLPFVVRSKSCEEK